VARSEGVVGYRELTGEEAHGPAVKRNVMHGQKESVTIVGQRHNPGAKDRTPLEVEGNARLLPGEDRQALLASCRRQRPQIVVPDREPRVRGDELHHAPLDLPIGRSKDSVALDDSVKGLLERRKVEALLERENERDVVDGVWRAAVLEEPEALLTERERRSIRLASAPGTADAMTFASSKTVGASKTVPTGIVTPSVSRTRATIRIA
jgi:hypothetical protein